MNNRHLPNRLQTPRNLGRTLGDLEAPPRLPGCQINLIRHSFFVLSGFLGEETCDIFIKNCFSDFPARMGHVSLTLGQSTRYGGDLLVVHLNESKIRVSNGFSILCLSSKLVDENWGLFSVEIWKPWDSADHGSKKSRSKMFFSIPCFNLDISRISLVVIKLGTESGWYCGRRHVIRRA